MNGHFEEKPDFDFHPTTDCSHGPTCVKVIQKNETIEFQGKLSTIPTKYTAILKDSTPFTFTFGTTEVPPMPPIQHTEKPTTIDPEPSPVTETEQPEDHAQTTPSEPNKPPSDSNGNQTVNGGDEQDPASTTSSGNVIAISIAVLLVAMFAQIAS